MLLKTSKEKIRYGIVGLGKIAQKAVLPAFANSSNSVATAIISGNKEKLESIGNTYQIHNRYLYSEFEECLKNREIDAVYVSTPNFYHRSITELAIKYGTHVLCEKPLAVTSEDCLSMILQAEKNHVYLMVAYRLYFEEANLLALKMVKDQAIGEIRIFNSSLTSTFNDLDNIRLLEPEKGGGPLHDLGIYCVNIARRIFQAEPIEVFALPIKGNNPKFNKIDETVSCILKFPEGKVANFTVSFDSFKTSEFDLIGLNGRIRLENSYRYDKRITLRKYDQGKICIKKFQFKNQFTQEISYFSECIQKKKKPLPSGEEGLIDIKILEALLLSIDLGAPITLEEVHHKDSINHGNSKALRPSFFRSNFINNLISGNH